MSKPSEYRLVLRYVNPSNTSATGTIKIVPENVQEVQQTFPVIVKPSKEPALVTVPGPLVMNSAGAWTVRIALEGAVFLV